MTESTHSTGEREVTTEIEALHQFFCGWFGGTLEQSCFGEQFTQRFTPDLVFIPPAGRLLGLADISASVKAGYDSNPEFRVQIRNVSIVREWQDYVLATYEEWQCNALASAPPDNARIATVLFRKEDRLRWLHIHETWMPPEVMAAGPYDF